MRDYSDSGITPGDSQGMTGIEPGLAFSSSNESAFPLLTTECPMSALPGAHTHLCTIDTECALDPTPSLNFTKVEVRTLRAFPNRQAIIRTIAHTHQPCWVKAAAGAWTSPPHFPVCAASTAPQPLNWHPFCFCCFFGPQIAVFKLTPGRLEGPYVVARIETG